jgi:hypothetical protein
MWSSRGHQHKRRRLDLQPESGLHLARRLRDNLPGPSGKSALAWQRRDDGHHVTHHKRFLTRFASVAFPHSGHTPLTLPVRLYPHSLQNPGLLPRRPRQTRIAVGAPAHTNAAHSGSQTKNGTLVPPWLPICRSGHQPRHNSGELRICVASHSHPDGGLASSSLIQMFPSTRPTTQCPQWHRISPIRTSTAQITKRTVQTAMPIHLSQHVVVCLPAMRTPRRTAATPTGLPAPLYLPLGTGASELGCWQAHALWLACHPARPAGIDTSCGAREAVATDD